MCGIIHAKGVRNMDDNDVVKSRKKKRLGTSQIIAIAIIVVVIAYVIISSAIDGTLFVKKDKRSDEEKIMESIRNSDFDKTMDDAAKEFEKEMDEVLEQMEKDRKAHGIE